MTNFGIKASDAIDPDPELFGYGHPPKASQFPKGKSGNSKGRPRGSKNAGLPHERLFGRMLTIKDQGSSRRVTAEYAFLARMRQLALNKGGAIARILAEELEKHEKRTGKQRGTHVIIGQRVVAGTSGIGLRPLKIVTKLDRFRPTTRMGIEPWIVELALGRFGDKRLSRAEQVVVVDAVRSPQKVDWPSWWEVRPWEKKLGRNKS